MVFTLILDGLIAIGKLLWIILPKELIVVAAVGAISLELLGVPVFGPTLTFVWDLAIWTWEWLITALQSFLEDMFGFHLVGVIA